MKKSNLLGLLVFCFIVASECNGTVSNNAEINYINYPVFTGCGGVIAPFWNDGGNSAAISHNYDSTYNPNEFCVWTILADDSVDSISLGINDRTTDTNDGLILYTWKDSNLTSQKIPHGDSYLVIDAQSIAVAYSSDYGSEGNGFNLHISINKADFERTSPKAYFSDQDKGEFTYPKITGQESYSNDKQVSVVLHAPTEEQRQPREYRIKDLDTEPNHDYVDTYMLLPYIDSYAPHYKFIGRFSGQKAGVVDKSEVTTPFPMLYLFSSDSKGTGKGFTISWNVLGGGIEDPPDVPIPSKLA